MAVDKPQHVQDRKRRPLGKRRSTSPATMGQSGGHIRLGEKRRTGSGSVKDDSRQESEEG